MLSNHGRHFDRREPQFRSWRAAQALAEDLTLVCMLGSGNDYMPGTRGLQTIPASGNGGLWQDYLQMRASKAWAHR